MGPWPRHRPAWAGARLRLQPRGSPSARCLRREEAAGDGTGSAAPEATGTPGDTAASSAGRLQAKERLWLLEPGRAPVCGRDAPRPLQHHRLSLHGYSVLMSPRTCSAFAAPGLSVPMHGSGSGSVGARCCSGSAPAIPAHGSVLVPIPCGQREAAPCPARRLSPGRGGRIPLLHPLPPPLPGPRPPAPPPPPAPGPRPPREDTGGGERRNPAAISRCFRRPHVTGNRLPAAWSRERKGAGGMAAEGDVELELETEPNGGGGGGDGAGGRAAEKPRKHDSGAADLERVTDYAEEKEIQSSNLETAMSVIGDRRSREQKAKQEREKELAKVTIKKEDLELIMTEMEISRAAAERSLREHMGNVVEALVTLTN
uniref:Nascent polypeptide-associated complex subunit alpha-like UBA domain-containing protein n=3 Tax=Psittaciformes TaxID=9223 RepID=A0A8V5GXG2_MELUD